MKTGDMFAVVLALALASLVVRYLILNPDVVGDEVSHAAIKLFGGYDA